jgi:hypothetical protein
MVYPFSQFEDEAVPDYSEKLLMRSYMPYNYILNVVHKFEKGSYLRGVHK